MVACGVLPNGACISLYNFVKPKDRLLVFYVDSKKQEPKKNE